jgi:CTP synthase
VFHAGGLDALVVRELGLTAEEPDLKAWGDFVERVLHPARQCEIAIVGKYTHVRDAYKSLLEALVHAGAANRSRVRVRWVEGEELEQTGAAAMLSGVDGVVVPGGFGERGIEGKILAAQHARERGVPYLGLCLGMQVATIEFARHVVGWHEANSSEFDPQAAQKVIDLMPDQSGITEKGGTMRLGAYRCELKEGSLAARAYGKREIDERHRHRYEFNNKYAAQLQSRGLVLSGKCVGRELVEIIELPDHPWFLAVQFHPEFKSKPTAAQPLFAAFIGAAIERHSQRGERVAELSDAS